MSARQRITDLEQAGFTPEEIADWSAKKRQELGASGFSEAEIDTWFGKPPFDSTPIKEYVDRNMTAAKEPTTEGGQPTMFSTFTEAVEAGLQLSTSGLLVRGKKPETVLPEDASAVQRLGANIGLVTGDLPFMAGGFLLGGGRPVTGMAGAFALPMGMRKILMDAYEHGEVSSFQEFWDRAAGSIVETAKGYVTGAATALAGIGTGKVLEPVVSPTVKAMGTFGAELSTMVTVGKALEGETPSAQDFLDAAVVLGGAKAAMKLAGKLRGIYMKTGVRPYEVVQDAMVDSTIAQDVLSDNMEMPSAYGGKATPPPPPDVAESAAAAPEPPQPGSVEAAQQAMLERVVQSDKKKRRTLSDVYTALVDNLNPIIKAEQEAGGKLQTPESPYDLERLTRGIYGKGAQFLKSGTFDFDTYQTVGKPYEKILEPVKKDLDGFRAYMVAKRAIELHGRDIESGMPLAEARQVVEAGRSKYETAFQERLKYRDALLDYLHKSGILGADKLAAIREANKDYVPFYRFFEEEETGRPSTAKKVGQPIKRITGSERTIIDPIESDIKDTFLFLSLAEKNAARQAFVELGPPFAEKVKTPVRPITVTDKELQAYLDEHGMPAEAGEALTIFRPQTYQAGKHEIVVFREGKREVYKVDPDVADAFNATDATSASFLANMLRAPASLLRAGVTISPDFFSRNILRDAVSAFLYAGSNPIKTIKGAKSLLTQDTAFQNWMKAGGANATMVAIDRDYISQHLFELNAKTGLMERAWNVVKTPVEVLRVISELTENATRLGSVRDPMRDAKTKAQMQALALISKEATVDFSRHGGDPFFREWTRTAAFMNPGIQGMDRMVRAFKDNPMGTTAKGLAAITLPSLLLWWANHDDPRWQEIPRWQKDLFWIVMTKDHIYRMPKPYEVGFAFGTMPERMLEAFVADNPDAFKDLDKSIASAFSVNVLPTVAVPVIEQFANRSTFTGQPLIPSSAEKLLPEYQYTEYTTELTKALARVTGAFPGLTKEAIKDDVGLIPGTARALATPTLIENYVRAWSGGLGMYMVQAADLALRKTKVLPDPEGPVSTLADLPIIKAFTVRYPSASAQSIQDFYDAFAEKQRVFDTVMTKAKEGDVEAARKAMAFDQSAMVQLKGVRDTLREHAKLIRLVHKNPDIPPAEQRQLIDTYYGNMIEMARYGNTALRLVEQTVQTPRTPTVPRKEFTVPPTPGRRPELQIR